MKKILADMAEAAPEEKVELKKRLEEEEELFLNMVPDDDEQAPETTEPAGLTVGSRHRFTLDSLLVGRPLPRYTYPLTLPLSGTVTVHADIPRKTEKWGEFGKEALSWAQSSRPRLLGQTTEFGNMETAMLLDSRFPVEAEAALYSYFDLVLKPSQHALWGSGLLGPVPYVSGGALDKGITDRAVHSAAGEAILPIEIKHVYALLPGCSPFVSYKPPAAPGEDKTAQQNHVEQVYGYMTKNGFKYGVLCSDEEYYFLRVDEAGMLCYSDAIKHDQLQPSVMTALCYITALALQQAGKEASVRPSTSGGGAVGGNGWAAQLPAWAWGLLASVRVPLHLLWLRMRSPSAPQTIKSCSLNLGRRLGGGITGSVYEGASPLGLPLAIKVPSREGRRKQGGELQLQQLRNEVAAYEALRPVQGKVVPALVAHGTLITDAGDRVPFLAMQLLEGARLLDEAGAAHGPSTLAAAAHTALQAVHALGVAHCDVRGSNLLLLPDGSVKLVDFGHARVGAAAGPEDMERDLEDLRNLLGS